jgi:hypothetical protein
VAAKSGQIRPELARRETAPNSAPSAARLPSRFLDVGCMDDVQQQALRVYQDMALLALDLLSRIKARLIDCKPPFPRS